MISCSSISCPRRTLKLGASSPVVSNMIMAINSYYLNGGALRPLYFALVLLLMPGANIGLCLGREFSNDPPQIVGVEKVYDPLPQIMRTDESASRGPQTVVHEIKLIESRRMNNNLEAERFQKILRPSTTAAAANPNSYIHRKLRASTPLCSAADLSLTQGLTGYNNGIPSYTVQIVNLCLNPRCEVSNIHVACEAFASARPLDDLVFQRLSYNDCSVMNGAALAAGDSVAFEYANSSEYPMHIISAEIGPCTP